MRAVAREAGVSLGLVNYHYADKTRLIAAALWREAIHLVNEGVASVPRSTASWSQDATPGWQPLRPRAEADRTRPAPDEVPPVRRGTLVLIVHGDLQSAAVCSDPLRR